jgi:hypothetical protein
MMWVAMIPNAQVIVFPWEPWNPQDWTLELFVAPSVRLGWVIMSVLLTLFVLAVSIGYLQWKEKKQDQAENRQHELLFRF